MRIRGRAPVAVLLGLFTAATFAAISTEMLPVGLLRLMSDDLGVSDSRTGLLVSAYAVVVAVGSIPLTAVVARWPRRSVLAVLLVGYAVSNLALAVTDEWWVALACRLVAGAAHAGFFSVVVGAAVALVPAHRSGRAVAAIQAGNALALLGGVPLGTALGTAVGWRWSFVAAAALLLAVAALVVLLLPPAPAPASSPGVPVLQAVRARPLQRVALVVVVLMLGHFTVWTYVSPLLLDAGVPRSAVGLVLLGYGGAGGLGLLVAGAVVDRHPRTATALAVAGTGLALGAVALAGVAGPGGGPGATTATVVAVVVWGAAFGTLPTLLQTAALRASPDSQDAAPAVINATFNVGIAGGALLGAQLLLVSPPPLLALVGAALAAAALLLLPGGPRVRR